nr:uncharacterized protein LOC108011730 isoform X2 [Drosophila suzukii]
MSYSRGSKQFKLCAADLLFSVLKVQIKKVRYFMGSVSRKWMMKSFVQIKIPQRGIHSPKRNVGQGFGGPGQMFKEGDDQCKKQINETYN